MTLPAKPSLVSPATVPDTAPAVAVTAAGAPKQPASIRRSFGHIRLIVALLLCVAVVQGFVLFRVSQRGFTAMGSLEREGLPGLREVTALQEDLALFRLHSYEWLFAQDADKAAKAAKADEYRTNGLQRIETLRSLFVDGAIPAQVASVNTAFTNLVAAFASVRGLVESDFAGAMKVLDTDVPKRVAALSESTSRLKAQCLEISNDRVGNTVLGFTLIRKSTLGFGIASVATALLALVVVSVVAVRTRRSLSGVVSRLGTDTQEVTVTADRLLGGSRDLAQSSSQQAASVEETSASMEEIRSMMQRNAEHAINAKKLANEARQAAESGATDMADLTKAIADIKESSDSISNVLKTINEIAFQTNILALNAAVEAARAGEAGLGFAVVADEVRSLAQRCANASRETEDSISGSVQKALTGVNTSGRVAENLSRIVTKSREVDQLIAEIANATTEQSRGIELVSNAMTSIDHGTQKTAAQADQTAQDSQTLQDRAIGLTAAVDDLIALSGDKR
jgi:hypothetical protein